MEIRIRVVGRTYSTTSSGGSWEFTYVFTHASDDQNRSLNDKTQRVHRYNLFPCDRTNISDFRIKCVFNYPNKMEDIEPQEIKKKKMSYAYVTQIIQSQKSGFFFLHSLASILALLISRETYASLHPNVLLFRMGLLTGRTVALNHSQFHVISGRKG